MLRTQPFLIAIVLVLSLQLFYLYLLCGCWNGCLAYSPIYAYNMLWNLWSRT
ncbi:hypothetical protein Pint_21998 [Pistacia integerrima]|uniref:Uncharacterized protein n=1 Tax=Pistacia integerrima TaxID=434235 RepID=A0ACC0YL65_9ROSI|nr:hypothetical protein Pint_21998 [Pistacia integerrima]